MASSADMAITSRAATRGRAQPIALRSGSARAANAALRAATYAAAGKLDLAIESCPLAEVADAWAAQAASPGKKIVLRP
jgi:hypothetical protein